METVSHIVKHVSGQLSDQFPGKEYIRWGRLVLLEYMRQGLKEIATYRPEAFSAVSNVPLIPGMMQTANEGETIEALLSNKDGSPLIKSDSKLLKAFGAYANCPIRPKFVNGRPTYAVKSYAVDENDTNIFYVSPPVPAGMEASVKASVNSKAFSPTEKNWDAVLPLNDKFYNNLIDFMMARAYQRDTESSVSQQQAQRLFQLFYQAMGAKYKIDAARGSGYYLGEVGTGDSRAVIR